MVKLIKYFIVANGFGLLSACANAPAVKVKFDPMMPVPFLIVPNDDPKNNTHNSVDIYQEYDQNFEQEH
ncbi:MAG: hypothetical protein KAU26_11200 [Methylococcales bacterium]|nr:hypothetical protein [Methylococcales bacterium]